MGRNYSYLRTPEQEALRRQVAKAYREGIPKDLILRNFPITKKQLQGWVRGGRWNLWRHVDAVERKWKDRVRENLEVMSALAVDLIGGIKPEDIRKAPVGSRIMGLKLLTDAMEKSAKMTGELAQEEPVTGNSLLVNMDPGRSAELLGRLGLRPVVAIPAPLEAIQVDPGSSSIDKASTPKEASDDKTPEV